MSSQNGTDVKKEEEEETKVIKNNYRTGKQIIFSRPDLKEAEVSLKLPLAKNTKQLQTDP